MTNTHKNIEGFRKTRTPLYKAKPTYSDTYREGKGNMAHKPTKSLLNQQKLQNFLMSF